ncbi:hypothetical protein [Sinorhizobium sp. Sb3]|uniref:hypothetical protein n=2 Tax=Rhizobiaceae TaxID=82115 RepID=UPI001FD91F8C|nr:hypothetical protein [Sinorhizobium sp. Sb3]
MRISACNILIIAGQATQAQFNHPDLGGMGQWSQGGMIMVGDMFNNALKANVAGVCSELAALVRGMDLLRPQTSHQSQGGGVSLFVPGALSAGNWWPEDLGHPASTGAQNDLRYAFLAAGLWSMTRRTIALAGSRNSKATTSR